MCVKKDCLPAIPHHAFPQIHPSGLIPLFSIFKGMGLLDTHLAVIIPQIAVGFPMAIFIICGFMRSIPTELEEAAIIDGCTVFQCFFKIILPIAKSDRKSVV